MTVADPALAPVDVHPGADALSSAVGSAVGAGSGGGAVATVGATATDAAARRTFVRITLPSLSFVRGVLSSLRWRLTLTFTIVVFLMLSSFSMGAYYYFAQRAIADIQSASRSGADFANEQIGGALYRAQAISAAVAQAAGTEMSPELRDLVLRAARSQSVGEKLDELRLPGLDFQLFWANGQQIYSSRQSARASRPPAGEGLLIEPDKDDAIERGTQLIPLDVRHRIAQVGHDARIAQFDTESMYIFSRPIIMQVDRVRGRAEPVAYIQILTSLTPHNRALAQLRRMLVLGTLFATMLSLLIGAALAQTAIAPIGRIQRTADRINREQDLGRRIASTGAEDELGRLAVTINLMLDRIEGMFDRQRRFLADVSHELRTPLTTIRGEVELMSRTGITDPDALKAVQAEAERMSRMIDDLLMLARADSGVPVVKDARPVSVDGLLLDVYQQACMLSRGSHRVELDIDQPAVVIGDPDRLKQLVLNLMMNALTHTPAGTMVRLGLRPAGRDVVVTVADNGPGIPEADLLHIWDRFFRADKARARASGGTGLGLAIVQSIAQAHGGSVAVESAPGTGTTFSVRLPAGG